MRSIPGGGPASVPELAPELVLDARAELGEGPVWNAAAKELLWVDIAGRQIHRHRPETGADALVATPSEVGAVAPRRDGGLVLALADGFWLLDPDDTAPRRHRPAEADRPETRFNDGKVDPAGRFWAGTMAHDCRPGAGSLYRLDPDGRVETVLREVTISNGMAWSADGGTFYYIDTPTRRIDAFDHDPDSGAIGRRRPLVRFPQDLPGSPDGMTIDAQGALWVALWDGWAVHRYLPDGRLAAIVRMPVARPTSCTFGGEDLGDLYITSARDGLSEAELANQPNAGGLFRVRPGVIGGSSRPFAG